MHRSALLGLLLVGACQREPVFELSSDRTCAVDVLTVDDGLLSHLVTSEDGGRTFDHDPASPLVDNVRGTYDLESGAFSWDTTFVAGHWRKTERVEGTGTAYVDGDIDLDFTVTTQLLGNKRQVNRVRELRLGCDVERSIYNRNDELVAVENGTVQADGYHFVRSRQEGEVLVDTLGLLAPDGSSTEAESWRVGRYQYAHTRDDDGAGKVVTEYEEVDDGVQTVGSVREQLNGSQKHAFTSTDGGATLVWDYTVSFQGEGEGTLEVTPPSGNGYSCDVSFVDFECVVSCPGVGPAPC